MATRHIYGLDAGCIREEDCAVGEAQQTAGAIRAFLLLLPNGPAVETCGQYLVPLPTAAVNRLRTQPFPQPPTTDAQVVLHSLTPLRVHRPSHTQIICYRIGSRCTGVL